MMCWCFSVVCWCPAQCGSETICYISCFQGLPLFWTSAHKRGFAFPDVVKLLCKEPARLCRLDNRKGSLVPGHDADLVIWDPEKEFTVSLLYFTEFCLCVNLHQEQNNRDE